jgi:hypothetical protein
MKAKCKGALKEVDESATAGRGKGLRKAYEPRFCNVVVNQGRELSRIPRRLVGLSQAASAAGSSRAA